MAEPIPADEQSNYETFRDCLSEPVLRALAAPVEKAKPKKKRHVRKSSKSKITRPTEKDKAQRDIHSNVEATEAQSSDAEDLGDFIEYLSAIIFTSLPPDLRTLTYSQYKDSPRLQDLYTPPLSTQTYTLLLNTLPPPALDSLESYALLPPSPDVTDVRNLLLPVLNAYTSSVTAPPPIWSTTRTSACELCGRDWVPLTYHHLIPKSTHERVLKRGWHAEEMLGSVAWLCRACHSFVHRLARNEELARGFYTVDLIVKGGVEGDEEKRAEVEGWVRWVGGVRWRSR
ncbi:Nn.00g052000.m01.CDS01 [Neocucurbitaria sp. VM-36]